MGAKEVCEKQVEVVLGKEGKGEEWLKKLENFREGKKWRGTA